MSNKIIGLGRSGQVKSLDTLKTVLRPLVLRHVRDCLIDPFVVACYATARRHPKEWTPQQIETAITELFDEGSEDAPAIIDDTDRGWTRSGHIDKTTFKKASQLVANIAYRHSDDRKAFVAACRRDVPKVASALTYQQRHRLLFRLIPFQWPKGEPKPLHPARYALAALKKGGRHSGTSRKAKTSDQRDKALELRRAGQGIEAIAEALHIPKSTVGDWLKGIKRPKTKKLFSGELTTRADKRVSSTPREVEKSTSSPEKPEPERVSLSGSPAVNPSGWINGEVADLDAPIVLDDGREVLPWLVQTGHRQRRRYKPDESNLTAFPRPAEQEKKAETSLVIDKAPEIAPATPAAPQPELKAVEVEQTSLFDLAEVEAPELAYAHH